MVFLLLLLPTLILGTPLFIEDGDYDKGQTYYRYLLYPLLKHNGAVFAKQHTKAQWRTLLGNDAKLFYAMYHIPPDTLDAQTLKHLSAFLIHYAKDSDVTPVCVTQ